jgi:hypothetical protein
MDRSRLSGGERLGHRYHLGELFRQKSLATAVSGYCYSSCSRLFLGGNEHYFSSDYPSHGTHMGFMALRQKRHPELGFGEQITPERLDQSRHILGRAMDSHAASSGHDPFL